MESVVAAPFLDYKRDAFEHPDETPAAFTLDLVAKDLELVLALAGQLDVPMEQAPTNASVAGDAAEELSGRDMSAIAEYLRRKAR